MNFLSGAFLLGLVAVAAPVVIHLIHRQRYPERRFTTLRFFNRTIKHNVLQNRLIDRLLLALRVCVCIAHRRRRRPQTAEPRSKVRRALQL